MKEEKAAKILKRRLYRHYAKQYNEEITLGIRILTPIDKAIGLTFPRFKSADREKCDRAIDRNIWALKELYDIKARIRERERLKPSSAENDRLKQALEAYLKARLEGITWRITHPYTAEEAKDTLTKNKEQLTTNEEPTLSESEIEELVEKLTKKTSAKDDIWNLFPELEQPKNSPKLRAEEILANNYGIIPKRVTVDAATLEAMLFPPTYFDTFKHHFYHSYPLLPVRWVSGLILLVLALIATPLYGCCLGYREVAYPGLTDENLKDEKGIHEFMDTLALEKKSNAENADLCKDSEEKREYSTQWNEKKSSSGDNADCMEVTGSQCSSDGVGSKKRRKRKKKRKTS